MDENGLSLDTEQEFTPEEKAKWSQNENGIVDLSEWANNTDGTSRVKGYTYDHAALRSRDGQVVTGLKAVKENGRVTDSNGNPITATTYRLYYTTDATVDKENAEANHWTLFRDYGTDTYANNSFVYLVYTNIQKPVTVHFLDTSGNAIKDSDGNNLTKVIDAADHTTEYDLVSFAKANIPNGYSFSDSNMNSNNAGTNKIIVGDDKNGSVTIGSVKGTYERYLKYEDGSVKFRRGNTELQSVSDPVDIYITFTKSTNGNDPSAVTIHHVDRYGAKLAADTTDTFGFTNSNGSSNISAFTNRWNGSSANSSSGASYFAQKVVPNIGRFQKAYIGKFNDENNIGTDGLFYKKTSSTGSWQTGTGSMGSNGSNVTKEITVDGKSGLYTDVYNVYSDKKGLTIHYVDEYGNEIQNASGMAFSNGGTFTAQTDAPSVAGYTYKEAHINSLSGPAMTSVQYELNDDTWISTVKNGEEAVTSETNPVNEVWLVYSKGSSSKTITLHYQYVNKSGSYSDAYYDNSTDNKKKEITVKSGARNYLVTDPLKNGAHVETIYDGNVWRNPTDGETGKQPLVFMSSHLAGPDGPTINSVDVTSSGNLIYHTVMQGTAEPDDQSANPTSWTLSQASGEQKGRSVSITKGSDGYLKLTDSLTGDIPINLVNDEAGEEGTDEHVGETYKGTLQNATTDVDYVVTVMYTTRTASDGTVTRIPEYGIEITNSYPSTSTDVYQVYIDGSNKEDKFWIEDDMKYTGLFRLDATEQLKQKLAEANDKNAVIEWHRLTTSDSNKSKIPTEITSDTEMPSEVTDQIVYRKISGEHWNLALNANERTWLDIEADEGTEVWRQGTTRAYYAKVTYTPKGASQSETFYTTPLTVNYYGQLENGSFEEPSTPSGKGNNQFSNEDYKKDGGVWQTTGPGSSRATSYAGRDIEIVNATQNYHQSLKNDYHWQPTTEETNNPNKSWAADGNQFAELNAENAGALYQDVITHPNEKINYWLSHRARGNGDADSRNYHYDTMYVVIMPTKLAMTMGNNGTELKTQTELQNFISAHGGFDSEVIKAPNDNSKEEATMTYYDEDAGIMIYKIRSDENGWHNVAVNNQYTAKGGLTRFFFAAASTAADKGRGEQTPSVANDPPTMGNFIDNVGFNQQLPPTQGFNLTVTETFSGITMEQLAGLASNASDSQYNGKNGISAQTNPLQVTLTNTRTSNVTAGTTPSNDALNGAKLSFTMSYDNDGNLVLTPTATAADGKTDLFGTGIAKPGSGEVRQYPDGRIVITWKFPDQDLTEGTGHSTLTEKYKYVANDNSTTAISGLDKTTSQNAVNNKTNDVETTTDASAGRINSDVTTKADKNLNIINTYSPASHISVRKTFSGVTPSTVNEMMTDEKKPYSITITKDFGDSAVSKTLDVNGGKTSDGKTDPTVSVRSTQGSDGSTTYVWTIVDPNWANETYSVKENNYITNRNALASVTVNGTSVKLTGANKDWPSTDPTVEVSDEVPEKFVEIENITDGVVTMPESGRQEGIGISSNTTLIVGQYTLSAKSTSVETGNDNPSTETSSGEASASNEGEEAESGSESSASSKRYIVWTASDVGRTTRRAIIAKINEIWGETADADKATSANTFFFTGDDAYVVRDGRIANMVRRQTASLTGQTANDKWDKYYAAHLTAGSNSSFTDESEIRIDNEYTPKIKIQKQSSTATVDATNNEVHDRLNGAEFRLYKKGGALGSERLYYQNDDSKQWKADADKAKVFTTGEDSTEIQNLGSGIALLDDLPIDGKTTYYLEESKAPNGYNKVEDIAFKIRANGTVGLADEKGNDSQVKNDKVQVVFNDPYYTIIVNDDPGNVLPETGGLGTRTFIFTGLALVLLAGAWLGLRSLKKRQIRGDK